MRGLVKLGPSTHHPSTRSEPAYFAIAAAAMTDLIIAQEVALQAWLLPRHHAHCARLRARVAETADHGPAPPLVCQSRLDRHRHGRPQTDAAGGDGRRRVVRGGARLVPSSTTSPRRSGWRRRSSWRHPRSRRLGSSIWQMHKITAPMAASPRAPYRHRGRCDHGRRFTPSKSCCHRPIRRRW